MLVTVIVSNCLNIGLLREVQWCRDHGRENKARKSVLMNLRSEYTTVYYTTFV